MNQNIKKLPNGDFEVEQGTPKKRTVIDKEYLEQLKEEDYIAWDDLVNDPMVVGQKSGNDFLLPVFIFFVVL